MNFKTIILDTSRKDSNTKLRKPNLTVSISGAALSHSFPYTCSLFVGLFCESTKVPPTCDQERTDPERLYTVRDGWRAAMRVAREASRMEVYIVGVRNRGGGGSSSCKL